MDTRPASSASSSWARSGDSSSNRPQLSQSIGEQRREPLVHQPALDRIKEEVVPFPSLHPLDQQLVCRRKAGPLGLELEDASYGFHFGPSIDALASLVELVPNRGGQLG